MRFQIPPSHQTETRRPTNIPASIKYQQDTARTIARQCCNGSQVTDGTAAVWCGIKMCFNQTFRTKNTIQFSRRHTRNLHVCQRCGWHILFVRKQRRSRFLCPRVHCKHIFSCTTLHAPQFHTRSKKIIIMLFDRVSIPPYDCSCSV